MDFQVHLSMPASVSTPVTAPSNPVDVAVIGAGPAGVSAGIYAKRKGWTTLILAKEPGGQVRDTSAVENYPGISSISGAQLAEDFLDHARFLELPIMSDVWVSHLSLEESDKVIHLSDGQKINARSVIIASGSRHRTLDVPGETDFSGKGVAYCAICDAPFFQDLQVAVVGGGNAAVEAVIDLAKIASHVTLVHRSTLKADKILLDRMKTLENISVHLQTGVVEIQGGQMVTGLRLESLESHAKWNLPVDGVFVEIGYLPNTEAFRGTLPMNEKGELLTDGKMRTSIPGVFAAGDVVEGPYKQIVISASQGAIAALAANEYLNQL